METWCVLVSKAERLLSMRGIYIASIDVTYVRAFLEMTHYVI